MLLPKLRTYAELAPHAKKAKVSGESSAAASHLPAMLANIKGFDKVGDSWTLKTSNRQKRQNGVMQPKRQTRQTSNSDAAKAATRINKQGMHV